MQWVLPGGAILGESNREDNERTLACRPLAAVEVRTIPVSLFPCPNCHHPISTKAETCPHCGRPVDSIELPSPVRIPPQSHRMPQERPGRHG
jgi:uncharacterized protein YlaI